MTDNGMHALHEEADQFAFELRDIMVIFARTDPLSTAERAEFERVSDETYELQAAARTCANTAENADRFAAWVEGLRMSVDAVRAKYRQRPEPASAQTQHNAFAQLEYLEQSQVRIDTRLEKLSRFPVMSAKGRADIDRMRTEMAERLAQKRPQLTNAAIRTEYARDLVWAAEAAHTVLRDQVATTAQCVAMGRWEVQRYSTYQDLLRSFVTALLVMVPGL